MTRNFGEHPNEELVADFGGISAPEVLFERKSLSGDPESGEAARERTAADASGSPGAAICLQGNGIDRAETAGCNGRGWNEDDVCYTLNTIDRPAVCAGFKAGQSKDGGIGWEVEQAPTLSADCSGMEPTVFDARGNGNGNRAPTITGDHQNRITDYTAICIGNGQVDQAKISAQVAKGPGAVCSAAVVRRLTPMECERLQAFPDGWTDIGEWIDTKGKKHKTADSQRYRALGNSLALSFWAWLAERICEQYDRQVEMASLFDGIGGFPLVFERAGAKAVWASEVEEFCIAVTKRRFPE